MKLYVTNAMPIHWIVEDNDGKKWIVPARYNGWTNRVPYNGNYKLEPAPLYCGVLLGLPE